MSFKEVSDQVFSHLAPYRHMDHAQVSKQELEEATLAYMEALCVILDEANRLNAQNKRLKFRVLELEYKAGIISKVEALRRIDAELARFDRMVDASIAYLDPDNPASHQK